MKAVAIFKWAPNPDDALVRVDGTVNWSTARHYGLRHGGRRR